VLLALTAGLLDRVPLDNIVDAEQALRLAAASISPDISSRLSSSDNLNEDDKKALLDTASRVLLPFQPSPKVIPVAKPAP